MQQTAYREMSKDTGVYPMAERFIAKNSSHVQHS